MKKDGIQTRNRKSSGKGKKLKKDSLLGETLPHPLSYQGLPPQTMLSETMYGHSAHSLNTEIRTVC